MAIKKQAFYEGAALHLLVQTGRLTSLKYFSPFFLLNDRVMAYVKYCTRSRSPWAFTFTAYEQIQLYNAASTLPVVLGLVCGADGVAAVLYSDYLHIAAPRDAAMHTTEVTPCLPSRHPGRRKII